MHKTTLVQKFRNLSIHIKLTLVIALVSLFLLGGTILFFTFSRSALRNETKTLSSLILENSVTSVATEIATVTTKIFDNYNISVLLAPNMNGKANSHNELVYSRKLNQVLAGVMSLSKDINWIVISDVEDDLFSLTHHGKKVPYDFQTNQQHDKEESIEKRARLSWHIQPDGTINISRMIYNPVTLKYTGYVIVNLNPENICSFSSLQGVAGLNMLILDNSGQVMLSWLDPALESYQKDLIEHPNSYYDTKKSSYLIMRDELPGFELTSIQVMSLEANPARLRALLSQYLLVGLLITLLAALISGSILRLIRRNVQVVEEGLEQISQGYFTHQIVPVASDEIGSIGTKVNEMAQKISDLLIEIDREASLRNQAEYLRLTSQFEALQAQMNPHFLFNMLEAINGLAKLGDNATASKSIITLSVLLRKNLARQELICSLEDEIEYVKSYIQACKIIYPNKITAHFEIDADLYDVPIPTFSIQPLVENAIFHGLRPMLKPGNLWISALIDNDLLTIAIEDDGAGFPPKFSIAKLGTTPSIGLANVQARIHLVYGSEYGIKIDSKAGQNTRVTVLLPL